MHSEDGFMVTENTIRFSKYTKDAPLNSRGAVAKQWYWLIHQLDENGVTIKMTHDIDNLRYLTSSGRWDYEYNPREDYQDFDVTPQFSGLVKFSKDGEKHLFNTYKNGKFHGVCKQSKYCLKLYYEGVFVCDLFTPPDTLVDNDNEFGPIIKGMKYGSWLFFSQFGVVKAMFKLGVKDGFEWHYDTVKDMKDREGYHQVNEYKDGVITRKQTYLHRGTPEYIYESISYKNGQEHGEHIIANIHGRVEHAWKEHGFYVGSRLIYYSDGSGNVFCHKYYDTKGTLLWTTHFGNGVSDEEHSVPVPGNNKKNMIIRQRRSSASYNTSTEPLRGENLF